MSEKEEIYIMFDGKEVPIKSFKEFIVRDSQVYLHNKELGLSIPIDIEDKEMMENLGIKEFNIRMLKAQLENQKVTKVNVPEDYENKFCAIWSGKVFHSFDTKKELDDFRVGPKNVGLTYSFYYPE